MLISPAYAQSTAAGGSLFELLFPLVMVFAIIYFMILRPQQKRQREHANMVEALRRGDTVITQGGLSARWRKWLKMKLKLILPKTLVFQLSNQ